MLRASAVLLSGGAAGALTMDRLTTDARAAEADLSVAGDDVTVRDGSLAAVWLDLTAEWAYALPSGEQPATAVVDVLAGASAEDMTVVDSAEESVTFLEESGERTFSVDLLDAGVLDADELVPAEGGETAETTVHLGVEFRVIDENGLVVAADSQTDTAVLAIEKSDYDPDEYGAVGGSGALTVELE